MEKKKKKVILYSISAVLIAGLSVCGMLLFCHFTVAGYNRYILPIEAAPECHTALVLGCSPVSANGRSASRHFRARVKKAAELYHSGKVRTLLLSGDNSRKDYNEPQAMRAALVAMRVPDEAIYCDYAGFRTIDSVIRADAVFGQRKFIIISQTFHCERAIYLARHLGLECYGFAADIPLTRRQLLRRWIREVPARVNAVLDVLSDRQPKFYGARIDMTSPQKKDPEQV